MVYCLWTFKIDRVLEKSAQILFDSKKQNVQMFDISVNFQDKMNADHILKSSEDMQSIYDTLFVILSTIELSSHLSIPMLLMGHPVLGLRWG